MSREDIGQTYGKPVRQNPAYTKFLPVFKAVAALIGENRPIKIAIEGRCGSGKSSLAEFLADKFDCNIFHMDDFFLPFELRTSERLTQLGGNIHHERLQSEVFSALHNHQPIIYKPYLCGERTFGDESYLQFKNLSIIEGSYCLHPALQQSYDYKIFLTVDPKKQRERIESRNGKALSQAFFNQWIPREEHYFSALQIQKQCDIVIDTTSF